MNLKVFAIFDEKARAYASPFYFHHDGEALRAFADLCEDAKSRVNRHPGDFRLYRLGEFDPISGLITGLVVPYYLAAGVQFVAPEHGAAPSPAPAPVAPIVGGAGGSKPHAETPDCYPSHSSRGAV